MRTIVIIPTLLSSEKRVRELVEQWRFSILPTRRITSTLHWLAILRIRQINTNLKTKVVETAVKAIEDLNSRYSSERKDIFSISTGTASGI